MSIINARPSTWYDAKWPYPTPGYFRTHHDFTDTDGRYYLRVHEDDMKTLEISGHKGTGMVPYWVALPPRSLAYLSAGDRLQNASTYQRYRAVRMLLDWLPRRRIAVVSLRASG